MKTRNETELVPIASKPGYTTIEAIYASDGRLCLAVNDRRVAGAKPGLGGNNIKYRWNVKTEELAKAARLDCEAARAEGYRQGVEDGKALGLLRVAKDAIDDARALVELFKKRGLTYREGRRFDDIDNLMANVYVYRNDAFRGASGAVRAEIRQRLERMERNG